VFVWNFGFAFLFFPGFQDFFFAGICCISPSAVFCNVCCGDNFFGFNSGCLFSGIVEYFTLGGLRQLKNFRRLLVAGCWGCPFAWAGRVGFDSDGMNPCCETTVSFF